VLAVSESVLTKRQKELGVALVNLGGLTTSVMVFEEGDVIHTKILPVGSGHITNDIAIGLRTSVDIAETIKANYGTAIPEDVAKHEEIDLRDIDPNENSRVSRKEVAEIIQARLEEILTMVNKELKSINRHGMLPAGIVFTGGGAKLNGIIEVAKKSFSLPAAVGVSRKFKTAIDKIEDPVFATALGLVLWGENLTRQSNHGSGLASLARFSAVGDATTKMKKWFKSLLP
jgi:cell division protein FtsA